MFDKILWFWHELKTVVPNNYFLTIYLVTLVNQNNELKILVKKIKLKICKKKWILILSVHFAETGRKKKWNLMLFYEREKTLAHSNLRISRFFFFLFNN